VVLVGANSGICCGCQISIPQKLAGSRYVSRLRVFKKVDDEMLAP